MGRSYRGFFFMRGRYCERNKALPYIETSTKPYRKQPIAEAVASKPNRNTITSNIHWAEKDLVVICFEEIHGFVYGANCS
jgi:hypothetical protein